MHRARAFFNYVCVGLGVLAWAPAGVLADDTVHVPTGTRVRVTVSPGGDRLTGRLLAFDDSTLMIEIGVVPPMIEPGVPRRDTTMLSRAEITSMAVSSGRRRGRGAFIGALVGAGAGVVIGLASGDDQPGSLFALTARDKAALGFVAFIPIGALVGAIVSPERWKEVRPDRIRISSHAIRGRGVGVSLGFAL